MGGLIVLLPVLALIATWTGYELFALATGRKLVTQYIRDAFMAAPGFFTVLALVIGILFGHFFWYQ